MRQQKAVAETCQMQPSAVLACRPQRVRASEGPLQLASKQGAANDPQSPKIVYGQPLSRPIAFSLALRRRLQSIPPHISTTSYPNSIADPIASFPTGFPRRLDGAIALANELQEEVSSG